VRSLVTLMEPFLPNSAKELARQIGVDEILSWEEAGNPQGLEGKVLQEVRVLFEKVPDNKISYLLQELKQRTGEERGEKEMVSLEEFKKLDLKVAKIVEVEEIEGAKKLYKLVVSLGDEERTLVAGLREFYSKEELLGKEVVVITNLEPAKIRGILSKGMLLAAVHDGKPIILLPEKEVPPGTPIY